MNGTESAGAGNQASGLTDRTPQSPSGARRVPVFVWVLIGAAAFFFLCIICLLALLAIPTLNTSKKQAYEYSAIQSVRTIQQAELMYSETYPSHGYACSLRALGGDPSAGQPSAGAAQLLPNDLALGIKSGYVFTISNCTRASLSDTERVTGYTITAVPQDVDKTGRRGFCSDEFGAIKYDPTGGTNCTQPLESR
jgi:type IV pilus assembly protein PilA